jgi:hypothetical protein
MAAGKGGDFGTTLGNILIPQTMQNLREAPLRQREIEKEQTQDEALKVIQNMIRLGAPMPAMQKVGALAFPEAAAARAQATLYPVTPKPLILGKDQRAVIEDKTQPAGFRELIGVIPDAPKVPMVGDLREFQQGDQKVYEEYTPKGWVRKSTGAAFAPKETKAPKTIADIFTERFGTSVPNGYKPVIGPDGQPTGDVAPLAGGPAAIGPKGLPLAYKQQMAGLDTLEQAVTAFRDKFAGSPAVADDNGKIVQPATSGTGTEAWGEDAGALDAMYTQIMLAVKNAEQAGALDQGMLNVMDTMLRKPTGALSPFQNNDYTKGQIKTILEGITRKRANIQKAFNSGAFDEDGTPQRGASGVWSAVEIK